MNSYAHLILGLPALKEVSILWDLNLSAFSSSQDISRSTRTRDRQSATNTPSYRCCPGSLLSSSPSCTTLPVHRSNHARNAVECKVLIPRLQCTVWYLVTPWAPYRERERKIEDLNTLGCRVRVVFNFKKVSMVRGFNSECVPRHVPST